MFLYLTVFFKKKKKLSTGEPFDIEKMFNYHTTTGKFKTDSFVGGASIIVKAGKYLKTNIHRNVSTVDGKNLVQ